MFSLLFCFHSSGKAGPRGDVGTIGLPGLQGPKGEQGEPGRASVSLSILYGKIKKSRKCNA